MEKFSEFLTESWNVRIFGDLFSVTSTSHQPAPPPRPPRAMEIVSPALAESVDQPPTSSIGSSLVEAPSETLLEEHERLKKSSISAKLRKQNRRRMMSMEKYFEEKGTNVTWLPEKVDEEGKSRKRFKVSSLKPDDVTMFMLSRRKNGKRKKHHTLSTYRAALGHCTSIKNSTNTCRKVAATAAALSITTPPPPASKASGTQTVPSTSCRKIFDCRNRASSIRISSSAAATRMRKSCRCIRSDRKRFAWCTRWKMQSGIRMRASVRKSRRS